MPAIDAVIVAAIVAAFVIFLGVLAWAEREKTLGRSAVSSLSLLIRSQRVGTSVNRRFRSGRFGSSLTRKPKRSQSPGPLASPYLPSRIIAVS